MDKTLTPSPWTTLMDYLKEAHNSFFGIGVDLFKSISRTEGLLRFPSY